MFHTFRISFSEKFTPQWGGAWGGVLGAEGGGRGAVHPMGNRASYTLTIGAYGHKFRAQRPYGQNFPGDPPTPGRGWVNTSRGISRQKIPACGGPKAMLFDVLPAGILIFHGFHMALWLYHVVRDYRTQLSRSTGRIL